MRKLDLQRENFSTNGFFCKFSLKFLSHFLDFFGYISASKLWTSRWKFWTDAPVQFSENLLLVVQGQTALYTVLDIMDIPTSVSEWSELFGKKAITVRKKFTRESNFKIFRLQRLSALQALYNVNMWQFKLWKIFAYVQRKFFNYNYFSTSVSACAKSCCCVARLKNILATICAMVLLYNGKNSWVGPDFDFACCVHILFTSKLKIFCLQRLFEQQRNVSPH